MPTAESSTSANSTSRVSTSLLPTLQAIRGTVARELGVTLCLWQCEAILKQLLGHHVLVIAATGQGKTIPFFATLLFQLSLILIIITPLNLLGKQQQDKLKSLGIPAIALNHQTATEEAIKVSGYLAGHVAKANLYIKTLHLNRVIILSPELALNSASMLRFWEKLRNMSSHVRLVIDEAHLMVLWSSFRRPYENLQILKHLLPPRTTYYLTSATLPDNDFTTILNNLALLKSHLKILHRSNDRFNLSYIVRPLTYSKKSKADLLFIFPDSLHPPQLPQPPPPFIIYFQSKSEAESTMKSLKARVSPCRFSVSIL